MLHFIVRKYAGVAANLGCWMSRHPSFVGIADKYEDRVFLQSEGGKEFCRHITEVCAQVSVPHVQDPKVHRGCQHTCTEQMDHFLQCAVFVQLAQYGQYRLAMIRGFPRDF